jgi:hypothetical protein
VGNCGVGAMFAPKLGIGLDGIGLFPNPNAPTGAENGWLDTKEEVFVAGPLSTIVSSCSGGFCGKAVWPKGLGFEKPKPGLGFANGDEGTPKLGVEENGLLGAENGLLGATLCGAGVAPKVNVPEPAKGFEAEEDRFVSLARVGAEVGVDGVVPKTNVELDPPENEI